jgi:hypothetical protein
MNLATRILVLLASALFCLIVENEAEASVPAPVAPPAFTTTRYNEDYSYLAQSTARSGAWWEAHKYIPLGDNPEVYLSTGTEFRLRREIYVNRLWGGAADPDDGRNLARVLPYADLHLGPSVRAFAQLSVAYVGGASTPETSVDQTAIDLGQAFLELSVPLSTSGSERLAVKGGRRQMAFGIGRVIAARYVPNVLQSFDGGFATLNIDRKWTADAFYTRPVVHGTRDFDDKTGKSSFYGLYAVRKGATFLGGKSAIDLYFLGLRETDVAYSQGVAREKRHTIGTRLAGSTGNWDWDWEAMYQFGRFGGGKISAWALGTRTAYTWSRLGLQPRLMLEASITSGDKDPNDPDLQTFNALFPNGGLLGELTSVGPYNLASAGATATAKLAPTVRVELQSLLHWRTSRADGIYGVPGNLIRRGSTSDARRIGTHSSLSMTWAPERTFDTTLTYGFFRAGRFLEETGPSDTTHFISAQARFRY